MRRSLLTWCLLLTGILCIAQQERVSAFWQSRDSNYNVSIASGPPPSTTTLDPVNLGSGIALSSGNLVATANSVSNFAYTRSLTSHSSGSYYFEVTLTNNNDGFAIGVANASGQSYASFPGSDVNSGAVFDNQVSFYINNSVIGTAFYAEYGDADTIGVAVNFSSGLIWFSKMNSSTCDAWNANVLANPTTGVGGLSLSTLATGPYYASIWLQSDGNIATANFGGSTYYITSQCAGVPATFGNY